METGKSDFVIKFASPDDIVKNLDIKKGDSVADFGCGAGFFSIPFSREIGEEGIVYALDVLPSALEAVESEAKSQGLSNIITKRVDLESGKGTGIPAESVNWVIIKNVLFQNKDKKSILKEGYRILKNGGKLFVMEWNTKNSAMGPELNLRIPQEDLEKIIEEEKFIIEKKIQAGDLHYIIIAVK